MRNPMNVLYYADFFADYTTVMKAILLFDELHIMDRPSMAFGMGPGQYITIGAASPLRGYEASLREQGVPLFVHPAPKGPVSPNLYEQIKQDVNDPEFLRRFQSGLSTSPTFRKLQIAPGDYGEFGDQDSVANRLLSVDLSTDSDSHGSPMALFEDPSIRPFELSSKIGCAKQLIADAVTCSAKLNVALDIGVRQGFYPLADATPYGDLLGTKYARALNALQPTKNKLLLTDLSFAIFDELVSTERLRKLTIPEVIRYRKASEKAREEFLEHLGVLQVKQAGIGADGDYAGAINKVLETEIKPAVRVFRNRLQTINDTLFGSVVKGAIGAAGGSSVLNLFGDLSWPKIVALAGTAADFVANAAIDAILAERTAKRECSVSYVLSLDE